MARFPKYTKHLPLNLTPEQYEWLTEESERQRRPIAEILRESIDDMRAKAASTA